MEHSFDIDIATEYGILEAVLLKHLWYWVQKNEANEKHYYDGNYWTYNSIKAFKKQFPYVSERQLNYALKKLVSNELLITGNYNQLNYDRTLWYAFTKKGKSILQNCQMEVTKLSNGSDKIVKPIPYIKPNNKNTDIKPNNKEEQQKENTKQLYDRLIDEYNIFNELKDKVSDWITYKVERKESFKEMGMKSLLRRIEKQAQTYGENAVIDVIDLSMSNNWIGICWDKLEKKTNNRQTDLLKALEDA